MCGVERNCCWRCEGAAVCADSSILTLWRLNNWQGHAVQRGLLLIIGPLLTCEPYHCAARQWLPGAPTNMIPPTQLPPNRHTSPAISLTPPLFPKFPLPLSPAASLHLIGCVMDTQSWSESTATEQGIKSN